MSNCTKCHDLGKKVTTVKCLACHTEIVDLINSDRGYHSNSDVSKKQCWDCHNEHHGRNFEIVRFDEKSFDHNKSGYKLKGSHKNIDCQKCHNAKLIVDEKIKKKSKTFLGLGTQCNNCHEDIHQGLLGNNCSTCHNEKKFIPAVKFNHDNSAYPLSGEHNKVKCISCHPKELKNGKSFQKFKGINFKDCNSCHNDIHKGKLGNNCKSCHSTNSFKAVNVKKGFDHAITGFKLIGKHKYVKCETCHKVNLTIPVKHEKCIDCHSAFHKGEFSINNSIKDCRDCHNEFGFSPSLFSIEMHNKTTFGLTFAHAATPCNVCHYKEQKWYFKINGNTCISCHKNIHENEISKEFFNKDKCESCHSTKAWNDLNFDHNRTKFKLTGKHKNTTCSNCHLIYKNDTLIEQKFSKLNSNCTQCHPDVHFGQFIKEEKEQCENCHTSTNWQPTLFNHSKTRFIIDGAHQKVLCNKCHKTIEKGTNKFVQYKIEDVRCISCHF